MKNYLYFVVILIFFSLVTSCSSSSKEQSSADMVVSEEAAATADTVSSLATMPQEATNESFDLTSKSNLQKTGRKFIRTADVKFKVSNVRQATLQIEDLTARYEGFITQSNLQTQVATTQSTSVSADSTLETKTYTVTNDMIMRVPNLQMDSLLRGLNGLVDFLDYRVIRAEDASLNLLSSQKQAQRLQDYEKRAVRTIDKQGRKLGETITAEDNLLEKQTELDQAHLNQLNLQDKIAYSTIQLQIYQRETVFREMIMNPANIHEYRPGLFVRVWESLVEGWRILEELVIFFARLWFLFAIAILGFFIYRRYGRRPKSIMTTEAK